MVECGGGFVVMKEIAVSACMLVQSGTFINVQWVPTGTLINFFPFYASKRAVMVSSVSGIY